LTAPEPPPVDFIRTYVHISRVRRKAGALVPLETSICVTAAHMRRRGSREFHGYEIAKQLAEVDGHQLLPALGTLYRALARLQKMGLVTSRWESSKDAALENRPARRLYTLTPSGDAIARDAALATSARTPRRKRRLATA
jgi:hypothetical protein